MIKVNQIKVPVEADYNDIKKAVIRKLRIKPNDLKSFRILKRSLDARRTAGRSGKQTGHYSMTVAVDISDEKRILSRKDKDISPYEPVIYNFPLSADDRQASGPGKRPVVIGMGPAGIFCALLLARAGYRPLVIERGSSVERRRLKVDSFWNGGKLDPECNVQFGEGGAGTFSDGKLNTLIKDSTGRHTFVLETFVDYGAPEEILYDNKPHVGTDILSELVKNIRNDIIRHGGEVRFDCKVTDFIISDGKLEKICLHDNISNKDEILDTDCAVLALGHSSRDTFQALYERGVMMERKAFAVGLRIEHPQEMINRSQNKELSDILPAASYKLSCKVSNGRNVYTFCMCPGGYVVNASSEPGRLTVNGMSDHARNSGNANSAVVVNVTPDDFGSEHPLAGVSFQRHWEEAAYKAGCGSVPMQRYGDYKKSVENISEKNRPFETVHSAAEPADPQAAETVSGDALQESTVVPVHKGAYKYCDLTTCLPDYVNEAISEGIGLFGRKIKGFDRSDALLSGVEMRTSSPVRIPRDEKMMSCNVIGLFPCGEGAGYAGGITSAAIDGIKIAEAAAEYIGGTENADN